MELAGPLPCLQELATGLCHVLLGLIETWFL